MNKAGWHRKTCPHCRRFVTPGRRHKCLRRDTDGIPAFSLGVGLLVRALRRRRGLTLAQAAKQAGVRLKTWWRWEGGMGSMEMIASAARALGCHYRDLIPPGPGKED